RAARWTLLLTFIAAFAGGILALFVAVARASHHILIRNVARGYIAVFEGIPVLMILFLSYYGLPLFGLDVPPLVSAAFALSLFSSAYLGDIWRGAIQSVPQQQWEAGASLALTTAQQYRRIILPQSIRIALPPSAGFIVILIKNTSIVSI